MERTKTLKEHRSSSFPQTDYLTKILNEISIKEESSNYASAILEKYISSYKDRNFSVLYKKFKFLCQEKSVYKNLSYNSERYLSIFFYVLIFLYDEKNQKFKDRKNEFLQKFILLIKFFFSINKLNKNHILILIKFITYSSIFSLKDMNLDKNKKPSSLLNMRIINYDRWKFSLDLVIKINKFEVTTDFLEFLKDTILIRKANLFLLTQKTDLLNLLYLDKPLNKSTKVIEFLSEIYCFKYNKKFLDIFMQKIIDKYLKNENPIEILKDLNLSIGLVKHLRKYEDKIYAKDPYILSHGFVCNDNNFNGINLENINYKNEFTLIFSFNFSPENTFITPTENNSIKKRSKTIYSKKRIMNLQKLTEIEYPIISSFTEENNSNKDGFRFFIRDNSLIHRIFNSNEEIKICEIKQNQVYICYYSIKANDNYIYDIRTAKDKYSEINKFAGDINKSLTLKIGNFMKKNFEGYIGTILLYQKYLSEEHKTNILDLKGYYDRILFFYGYDNSYQDKYDKNLNLFITGEKKKIPKIQQNYLTARDNLKNLENINFFLSCVVSPNYEESKLDKKQYTNYNFNESNASKTSYYIEPKIENGATFFFRNKNAPFEFLRYEGINYLILIFELIHSNVDNITKKEHKDMISNVLYNIINFSVGLVFLLNTKFYENEIRMLLFAIKKCINKVCEKIKINEKIGSKFNKWLSNLTTYSTKLTQKISSDYFLIRKEILNFLLNTELYDLKNFKILSNFFSNIKKIISKNSTDLLSMVIFQKIFTFSVILEEKYKTKLEYKELKKNFNELIEKFCLLYEKIDPYTYIYQQLSINLKFNYNRYQFIKLFYILSDYYYKNINNVTEYTNTWKYFIELYEFYQSNNLYDDLNQKKAQIIMALCLRFTFEYPIDEEFFKPLNSELKKYQNQTPTNSSSYYRSTNVPESVRNNSKSQRLVFEKKTNLKNSEQKRSNSEKLKDKNIDKNQLERRTTITVKFNDIENICMKNTTKSNSKKELKTYETNFNLDFYSSDSSKYYEYYSYQSLFKKLCNSTNFNDYCFRSLILLILEKNNEVLISQKIKLIFISKIKTFNDFDKNDFSQFLKLNYFNKETKAQFIQLMNLIEKNYSNLSHITYDLFLFLIIKIAKLRINNKCVFKHVLGSKKICKRLFLMIFNQNEESTKLILQNFSLLTGLVIPYHKKPFIFDLLKITISQKNLFDLGQKLINILLKLKINKKSNEKYYFYFKVNTVILLYQIIKNKTEIDIGKLDFDEEGLIELFDEHLILNRYNILTAVPKMCNKPKCYMELIYEILINLFYRTKKEKYYLFTYKIFIMCIQNLTKIDIKSKTIAYYIDQFSYPCEKNNPVTKYFKNYYAIEIPSVTIKLLVVSLKFYHKFKGNDDKRNLFTSLISAFYLDALVCFTEHKSKRKEYFNDNYYNYLRNILYSIYKKKTNMTLDTIIKNFENYYENEKANPKNTIKINSDLGNMSLIFPTMDLDDDNSNNDNLENSFSSCKSDKSTKIICANNKKKKMESNKKRSKSIRLNLSGRNMNKKDLFHLHESNINTYENNNYNRRTITTINFNLNNEKSNNPYNLDKIENNNKVVLFPKLALLEQIFGIYFTDILFKNELFIKMKKYFKYLMLKEYNANADINNFFDYPIITKNYIPDNLYFGCLLLKNDLNFFENKYLPISHSYFIDKLKNYNKIKDIRIFKKTSEQNSIDKYLFNYDDRENYIFYVDLITNRNVIFGELIVCNNLIFFHNIDKNKFIEKKTDEEKKNWLLCPPDCDYSTRNKKLYIFKNDIKEIINRRFLYLFQACEFYLKNGKSYYFNFYSEENKIKFFEHFPKNYVISDLKTNFKKNNFTKLWLDSEISTLEYLLFINKYSCRSYNDINQYPVLPWLSIYGNKDRDLQYTIAAQTEDERFVLREKYPLSNEHFPYHYATHYSNSSYLTYYLIRINPFTDSQITLQVNKFDLPNRQFNAIDDIQKILYKTKQPREIIPEFFLTTDFFYNYNCNFFGLNDNKAIIHNLINKKNYNSPLEYVLMNAVLLETPKFKTKINYFFDNIFGVGQMSGCNKYNTYNKYTYQEMIDLKQKIEKFSNQGLSFQEIKKKIGRKVNKIISFGQTPFKLLEDPHSSFIVKKNSAENLITKSKEGNDNINYLNQMIYMSCSKDSFDKNYILILGKKNINNYILNFYDLNLKEDKEKTEINIPKKIKLLSKLHIFDNNSLFAYKYNPKFIMINFDMSVYIFSHLADNSFSIFNQRGEYKSYLTESLITCIKEVSNRRFFTGHANGKIFEWEINIKINFTNNIVNLNDININLKRNYIAHKLNVSAIYYSNKLGLIVSAGDDKRIFIRKYYDLSLLTVINFENKICIDIKLNMSHFFCLFFDENENQHCVEVYSVNGIRVAKSDFGLINNIDFDGSGNILIGYFKEARIDVFNLALTKLIFKISLKDILFNSRNKKGKKENKTNYFKAEMDIFQSFIYDKDSKAVFCFLSNGYLAKKYVKGYLKTNKENNQ